MSSKYTVLWVDDDEDRRTGKDRDFGRNERIKVVPVEPLDLAGRLLHNGEELVEEGSPDLALVDWYLQTGEYSADGPSIEGILHDKYPEMPVYGFSNKYGDKSFMRERKQGENRFEIITSPDRLKDKEIIRDIEDYEDIESQKGEGVTGILNLLGADSDLKEKIQPILPQEFAEGIPAGEDYEPGGILRLARWIRHVLLRQPGMIWNEIWTATKLGIDIDAFDEYRSELSSEEYSGIFSHNIHRWWREEVTRKVYELASKEGASVDRTWKDAPIFLDVDEEHIALCDVCGNKYPETVAAERANEDPEFQVHYKCSNIENSRGQTFEDLRVLVEL